MKRIGALLLLVGLVGFTSTACLGVPTDGSLTTPGAPDTSTQSSRLPTLLQQLQGGNAGVELFDATPSSEVLGVQDQQGKDAGSTVTVTVTNTPGVGSPTSVAATPTTAFVTATPTLKANTQPVVINTPIPANTPRPNDPPQPTATNVPPTSLPPTNVPPTATPTFMPTWTPSPTPFPPTPTRTPTPLPTPTIPIEVLPTQGPPVED